MNKLRILTAFLIPAVIVSTGFAIPDTPDEGRMILSEAGQARAAQAEQARISAQRALIAQKAAREYAARVAFHDKLAASTNIREIEEGMRELTRIHKNSVGQAAKDLSIEIKNLSQRLSKLKALNLSAKSIVAVSAIGAIGIAQAAVGVKTPEINSSKKSLLGDNTNAFQKRDWSENAERSSASVKSNSAK